MKCHFFCSFIALFCTIIGIQSCSSDVEDVESIVLEDTATASRRKFCERFNLPQDKILDLNSFYGLGEGNLAMLTGYDNEGELAVILCDTIANEALYANYSQMKIEADRDFSLPYGEKKNLPIKYAQITGFATDGENAAAPFCICYAASESISQYAFMHYRFLYRNNRMAVVESPSTLETLTKQESVVLWFDNSFLFYYDSDSSSTDFNFVACYGVENNLCYEAKYPKFYEGYSYYDLLKAQIIQPISIEKGIGVDCNYGRLTVFAADIKNSKLLWHKDIIAIDGYEYKDNDRVELTNQSYKDGVLRFTLDVTSYDGSIQTFNVAVTVDGEISFS